MESEEIIASPAPAAELERLLKETAGGGMDALAELYRRTRGAVYALALSMTGDAYMAEELCHDAYLRIWDYAGSYRAKGSPMAWILAVTRNLCLMELRKAKRTAHGRSSSCTPPPGFATGRSQSSWASLWGLSCQNTAAR